MSDPIDYSSKTKEELLGIVAERGIEGIKPANSKADIITALQLADEQGTGAHSDALQPPVDGDLSNQGLRHPDLIFSPTQPKTSEFSGRYRNEIDGYIYELAVRDAKDVERDVKTHCLRVPPQKDAVGTIVHPGLYWEGTKDEFKTAFDKV